MSGHNILLLGATGASGLLFIQHALELPSPPALTLYTRSPGKIPEDVRSKSNVHVVQGDLSDSKALSDALEGVDVVVSLLGAYASLSAFIGRTKTTPIADAFPSLLRLMKEKKVHRILTLSSGAYVLETEKRPWSRVMQSQFPGFFLPQAHAEMHAIAHNVVTEAPKNQIEFTVFRVPVLTNGSPDTPVFAGLIDSEHKGSLMLSRASMVKWVLNEIGEKKWTNGVPTLGNY